jgi:large subunit ribosomal protein L9
VQLPSAVKSVGDYKVQVKLHPDVTATFTLAVTAAK